MAKKPKNRIFSGEKLSDKERKKIEAQLARAHERDSYESTKRRRQAQSERSKAKYEAEKNSALKEYEELKNAFEQSKGTGQHKRDTLYNLPEKDPSKLYEIKGESSKIKDALSELAEESRRKAKELEKESGQTDEVKNLKIKAKLDETWGAERERLKDILEGISKKDKESRTIEDYNDFWDESDTAVDDESDLEELV